ncbi:glycerate kinase [uncultured Roseibium sp.]|uniref:glycerate kinase type-2 family protein n=1 Tax=uncultured Roseibium sp. TaxID=1936171 RepID=UPI0026096CF1|nr:glycerate kinase [uncultured Roseibium sp.]
MKISPDALLKRLFDVAVAAADPMVCVPKHLPEKPPGRCLVIGAGKASARMAEALEAAWGPVDGLVITRDGYARPCAGIEVIEASHPVPDQRGLDATARLLELLEGLEDGDRVIALISGGASALLENPAGEISLEDLRKLNEDLLSSGAPIDQMNTVRKHVSRVKGGQLAAAAYPAHMTSLIVSDVAGDDPAFIASGPTVGDNTSSEDAKSILASNEIKIPKSIEEVLMAPTGVLPVGAPKLSQTENIIVAAPSLSLNAASELAEAEGIAVTLLGDAIEGEARDLAQEHASLALKVQAELSPGDKPRLLLSGGECTVTRRGDGIGGPNAEYALALALALNNQPGIYAIACDTDGVDGAADVAGARVSPQTLSKASENGVNAAAMLAGNDSHSFFDLIGDQIVTGPTLTNVNDFRAILIESV